MGHRLGHLVFVLDFLFVCFFNIYIYILIFPCSYIFVVHAMHLCPLIKLYDENSYLRCDIG